MKGISNEKIRTAGGGAGPEDALYLGVHHDAHLPLVLDSLVSGVDAFSDPVFEFLAYDGFDHVGYVRPWQLENLRAYDGQGPHGFLVVVCFCVRDELFDRQIVEERDLDDLQLVAADTSTIVAAQVSEMPGCHSVDGGQIAAYITAKESVDLYIKKQNQRSCRRTYPFWTGTWPRTPVQSLEQVVRFFP